MESLVRAIVHNNTTLRARLKGLECNKDLELYYLDSFKIVHEK